MIWITLVILLIATTAGSAMDLPLVHAAVIPEGEFTGWSPDTYCGTPIVVEASSSLAPQGERSYGVEHICDGLPETAWIEGVDGPGTGESVTFLIPAGPSEQPSEEGYDAYVCISYPLLEILVLNGYAASPELWRDNSRVKSLLVSYDGEPYFVIELEDTMEPQMVGKSFNPIPFYISLNRGGAITFTVIDTYPGDRWEDTALSELSPIFGQI